MTATKKRKKRRKDKFKKSVFPWLVPVLIFVVTTSIFIFAAMRADDALDAELQFEFRAEADSASSTLQTEMTKYYDLLFSGMGFFASTDEINRDEWDRFFKVQEVDQRFPSLEALVFLRHLPVEFAEEITETINAEDLELEGYPSFQLFPERTEGDYTFVDFIYPIESNEPLFGFDFASIAERVPLLEETMISGDILFTPPVKMADDEQTAIGFLMIAPVYGNPHDDHTQSVHESFIQGYILAVINTELVFEGLNQENIQASVFDATDQSNERLWVNNVDIAEDDLRFFETKTVDIGGRNWDLVFLGGTAFVQSEKNKALPNFIMLGGLFIAVLLSLLIFNLETTKNRALDLAKQLTRDLQDFKFALEGTSEHVVITDTNGVILFANSAACENSGYSHSEMIGGTPGLWGGQMHDDFYKKLWSSITVKKKPFTAEVVNRRKNGSMYDALISISPILDEQGEVRLFIGFERDITKEKEIDLAKTEFVSLASHQLRTPLSTINWYTEMLMKEEVGTVTAEQKSYLEEIYKGSKSLADLVSDLLNVSRLELGTFIPEIEEVKIRPFVNKIAKELKGLKNKNHIELKFSYAKKLPENLHIDKRLMSMILHNLFSNAMKYSPDGGRVELKLKEVNLNKAKSKNAKKALQFIVSDQGMGIPKKDQKMIFSKMFRAANAKTEVAEGTGLGLYMIKMMVEKLGGKISFESEENKGTKFFVTIPIKN